MAASSSGESRDLIGQDWLAPLSFGRRQNPAYSSARSAYPLFWGGVVPPLTACLWVKGGFRFPGGPQFVSAYMSVYLAYF